MAQLRNFQFLRNSTISSFANYAAARTAAISAFDGITTLQDGEIALYSYKLDGDATTVHTLLGIKRTNGIEIVANYDELTAEYQSYVNTQIQALDSTKTSTNNGVTVTVTQVDGKIDSVSVVAPSLGDAIAALDVNPFSLTTLNGDKLEGYQISEVDGKIVKGQTATTLLTFATAPTAENKVVTQAEITALNADKTSTNGTNVQVQVIEEAGKITGVNVTTDNTVNATDVEEAITEAIEGLDSEVENETGDIKVKVTQVNGELTTVAVTDTLKTVAHTGAAADVTIADEGNLYAATNVEAALAEVMTKANELDAAQLEAGTGIDIVGTTINADLKLSIANETTGEGESAVTTTYLYIKDTEGNEISKVDASKFVKDGFLQKVELIEATAEGQENVLRFTWNSDAGIQVTEIKVSDLCDVYTAKENDWIQLNGFEFSHKTVENVMGTYANNADNITVNSTEAKTFIIPTITVDGAGHVTTVIDKTVKIALPESIDTAVQTINGHAENASFITTTVTPDTDDNTTQNIVVTAKIGDYATEGQVNGLATTSATKTYVDSQIRALQDYNTETTVSAAENSGIIVTPTIENADAVNEQRTYEISLAPVTRVDNATEAGTAGDPSASSFADNANTFTYVKAVRTDANGRVLGIDTETVTENFDAGTY